MRRLLLAAVVFAGAVATAAAQTPTPLPAVTGPIPVTADSYPLMASNKLQNVVDLPSAGYVEEEFFVSGRANVYDWAADGSATVRTPAVPYTTRIMLRRPADPRKFSGNAIIEIGNVGRRFDFSFTWGVSHEYFMDNGDAWVAITYAPDNIAGLKAFNPTRYAPLSMANPAVADRCAPGGELTDPSLVSMEEGLRWDMISQVGALIRAAQAGGPLAGFNVQRVFATSHGGELATYISVFHSRAAGQWTAGLRRLPPASASRPHAPPPVRQAARSGRRPANHPQRRRPGHPRRLTDRRAWHLRAAAGRQRRAWRSLPPV